MDYTRFHAGERRTYLEMRQKPAPRDTFFSLVNDSQQYRPTSVATEFVDTDFDDEGTIISDDEDNSPRVSLQSSGQTTLSSFDEISTPRSSRSARSSKQVEGPRGPHLFRSSSDSSQFDDSYEDDIILSLSPITPKPRGLGELTIHHPPLPRRCSPFQYTDAELDPTMLASWTPEMVAQSMLNAGIEMTMADRFIENDINGAILITLKSEDLRELGIPSFGIRTRVWDQIQTLRDSQPASPRPETPIEELPSREVRLEKKKGDKSNLSRRPSSRRKRGGRSDKDNIMPSESVSIIGIEQVIPKPHSCSKGKDCSSWRKQQRLIEEFKRANPGVDMNSVGTVLIYGDAGNPETAKAIDPDEELRPFSDAGASLVASSDILGPGSLPPLQYLKEATLRSLQARDPQDNVRQFLNFQHQQTKTDAANEVPPTPPFEVTPAAQPHQGLRRLPRLSIPLNVQAQRAAASRASVSQQPEAQQAKKQQSPEEFVPYKMDKADPRSPDLETPRNPYRFGTPFSELDVPVTAVPLGPVARDASQSVPPNMNYHTPGSNVPPYPRSQSRASARRPSFPILPAVNENKPMRVSRTPSPRDTSPKAKERPLQPPPRGNYPWSSSERQQTAGAANGVTFQGPMKKRKTRILRSEWQDGYFTLKGTRLNMHKDVTALDRTLEYIDIDDYAIACSSLASTSKLSAAFKAVHISHNREKSDPIAAFSFQLVPQDKNGARLRKRESAMHNAAGVLAEGVNGTGKTHHFAVKGRDERIDWMREMMLAKALKQKGDGFEISVNGNMI